MRICAVVWDPSGNDPSTVNVTTASFTLERDRRYRARLHTGDGDLVANGESAGIGELGLVADRSGPLGDALRIEPDRDDKQHEDNADEPGASEV